MKIKIESIKGGIKGAYLKDIKQSVIFPFELEVSEKRFNELKNNSKIKVSVIGIKTTEKEEVISEKEEVKVTKKTKSKKKKK